jgi:hypothetical protein
MDCKLPQNSPNYFGYSEEDRTDDACQCVVWARCGVSCAHLRRSASTPFVASGFFELDFLHLWCASSHSCETPWLKRGSNDWCVISQLPGRSCWYGGAVDQPTTDSYAPMFGHTPPFCQRHLGSSDNQKWRWTIGWAWVDQSLEQIQAFIGTSFASFQLSWIILKQRSNYCASERKSELLSIKESENEI